MKTTRVRKWDEDDDDRNFFCGDSGERRRFRLVDFLDTEKLGRRGNAEGGK